ncbi:Uncharacterised protein [uncultured archaeon]|nr:Uncharacterised protein [uncultured archaeon]
MVKNEDYFAVEVMKNVQNNQLEFNEMSNS